MDWTKVVTDPLGLAGFALAAVFGVVSKVVAQKRRREMRWIVPAACALAAVCILGGLGLAYQHASSQQASSAITPQSQPVAPPAPSMRIGTIDQKSDNGAAVAGVQGNVTVNAPVSAKESQPKNSK